MPNGTRSNRTLLILAVVGILLLVVVIGFFVFGGGIGTFVTAPVATNNLVSVATEENDVAQEDASDTQDLAGGTKVQIRAFHDDNGDGQYGDANKPNDPSFEGTYFIGADIDVINEATGQQVDLGPICNNNGHLGGVGREFCDLPPGAYEVRFNGDTAGLTGPLRSRYNPSGINPVIHVQVTGGPKPIVEFGYTGTPDNGVLLIRKYVDQDGNAEYGATGAHSETSAEGTPFSGTTYKLYSVSGTTKTPVDPSKCFAGDFNFGGVGRDYCWLPAGTYEVDIDPNPDSAIYSGPFAEAHNGNADDPARITVTPQPTGGSTPAILDFGYLQEKVTLQVRAFHDDNGDGEYGDANKPNDPSFEGAYFISADYDVINEATGQPVNLAHPTCNNGGHLGGVGRDFCRLPRGNYTVRFNGDTQGLTGPLQSSFNPNGVNPMTSVRVELTGAAAISEFGYTGTSTNGVLLIRAYLDKDNNNEYGGGSAGETSAEGTPFSGTAYKLFSVSGSTKTPVDPSKCFAGDFELGGVGRDYCWLPPGTYEVDLESLPEKSYVGPFKEPHNTAGTDPAQVTVTSKPEGAGNPDIIDFGYKKKQTQVVVAAALPRCEGDNVVDQLVDCSQKLFTNPQDAKGIYLCRDNLFFDCFAGTPVMQKRQMTFLGTNTSTLSPNTKTEITRIIAGRDPASLSVIIAGQTEAVSANVETELEAMGLDVTRIGGDNRRVTARLLAEDLLSLVPNIDTVELSEDVVGMDAIAISPVAARAMSTNGNKERVILLTQRTGSALGTTLDENVKTFIDDHQSQIKEVEIIGGADAVPGEIDQELRTRYPGLTVSRLSGATRFNTTADIDNKYFTAPTSIVLAFGKPVQPADFTHGVGEYAALAGARIAAFKGGALVLSDTASIPKVIQDFLSKHAKSITYGEIVGGLSLVPKTVADEFQKLIQ